MQNLTTMNLVDVILPARVPPGRLVDWTDHVTRRTCCGFGYRTEWAKELPPTPSRPSRVLWTARAASLAVVSLVAVVPGQPVAAFGVYCPDTDAGYLVPTKNNQAKGVRWAKDCVPGATVEVAAAAG